MCSSFKSIVAEASAEETAAKEASDAKAEAEAAAAVEKAEAQRQEAAKQAKLDAAKSMEVVLRAGVNAVWFFSWSNS